MKFGTNDPLYMLFTETWVYTSKSNMVVIFQDGRQKFDGIITVHFNLSHRHEIPVLRDLELRSHLISEIDVISDTKIQDGRHQDWIF